MQVDPKAESFLSMSPFTGMGNNPISIIDPMGDSLNVSGSVDALENFRQLIFNSSGGHFSANIDENGNVSISENDVPDSKTTKGQANFVGILSKIIDSDKTSSFDLVDHSDAASHNIVVVDNGESELSATPGVHTIDVGDVSNFGNGGLLTLGGALIHELEEGYQIQVKGTNPVKAHLRNALRAENQVNQTVSLGADVGTGKVKVQLGFRNIRNVQINISRGNVINLINNER